MNKNEYQTLSCRRNALSLKRGVAAQHANQLQALLTRSYWPISPTHWMRLDCLNSFSWLRLEMCVWLIKFFFILYRRLSEIYISKVEIAAFRREGTSREEMSGSYLYCSQGLSMTHWVCATDRHVTPFKFLGIMMMILHYIFRFENTKVVVSHPIAPDFSCWCSIDSMVM